jgi:hypothetical protein
MQEKSAIHSRVWRGDAQHSQLAIRCSAMPKCQLRTNWSWLNLLSSQVWSLAPLATRIQVKRISDEHSLTTLHARNEVTRKSWVVKWAVPGPASGESCQWTNLIIDHLHNSIKRPFRGKSTKISGTTIWSRGWRETERLNHRATRRNEHTRPIKNVMQFSWANRTDIWSQLGQFIFE